MTETRLDQGELITAEIIRNSLETVCKELSATVENTALSPIFTLNHDYSCGVFYSGDGGQVQLLARDQAVPVHIFASLDSVQIMFETFPDDIREGDVFLVTDPYMGGTHCPDWTIIRPVTVAPGVTFLTCVRGHVNDVGGPVPGNYNVNARDVWQEGFRIPPVRIVSAGEHVGDIWETILANTRLPAEVRGDLMAMVGACQVGERRIRELARKYGVEMLRRSVDYIVDYSEKRLRATIAEWPDGSYEHTGYVDHDFAGNRDVPVRVKVTVSGEEVVVDFDGTSGEVPGFINSPTGNTISQVFTALTALCPDIPINSGFFRPVSVVLHPQTMVNPDPPAPVGNCTLTPGTTIIDTVMKAFEQIRPELVGTAAVDMNGARCFGVSAATGRYWVSSDLAATAMSAGGARGTDGWGGWAATFCALNLPPLEMFELQFPWEYVLDEYARDTAAPGRWRGAPAIHYRRRHTDQMRCTIYNGGARNTLVGYAGGGDGAGNYWVIREGEADEMTVTESCYAEPLSVGSLLFAQSGGGGGWGDPFEREPAAVLDDWLDDIVSTDGARRDYGVVIDPARQEVDLEATRRQRAGGGSRSPAAG
ncbi:MAG: hydantoinase B/oxoprolinase family protein [Actinobacteria bacterium]|nr:hydantoinase B/oxoprolinase family protein [Actinomycetota bacterium]